MNKTIAILINADIEWLVVKEILNPTKLHLSPFGEWFPLSSFSGTESMPTSEEHHDLLFFQGGWGKISAAAATQYLIDHWKPYVIINLGTCGGIAGRVEIGKVVLVERAIVYDIHEKMGDAEEHLRHYQTHIDLSWISRPFPQEVLQSTILSADRDLDTSEVELLSSKYHAVVADWESGAIAFVCARNQQRLIILRGVSDLVSATSGEAYGNIGLFKARTQTIMQGLIEALPGWVAACNIEKSI